MEKAMTASVSHTEAVIKVLRADRQFAVEYLKAALEELDDPNNRAAGLLALRDVAEACGGLAAVAAQADISREALLTLPADAPSHARVGCGVGSDWRFKRDLKNINTLAII